MGRPRKHNTGLPDYVRVRHGSYVYKDEKLCRVTEGIPAMYTALGKRMALGDLTMVPAAVAAFKLVYLPTLAASTSTYFGDLLDVFAEEFQAFRVDQIEATDIKASIDALYPNAANAASKYKARVSTFMRWAIVDKGLRTGANPCAEIRLKKAPKRRTKWNDRLFWAMRDELGPMQQCYHDLSFLLYQRTTDVRHLDTKDIDRAERVIRFEPTKTRNSTGVAVDIVITPEIEAVLERAAAIKRGWKVVSSAVICTRRGTPYTANGLHQAYERADIKLHGRDAAGNPILDTNGKPVKLGLNPKSLLPYACTSALKQGYTKAQIQEGRRHASIVTTEGYIQQHEVPVSTILMKLPRRPK